MWKKGIKKAWNQHESWNQALICGRRRIRTSDPLLVRQMLWTGWAMRPLRLAGANIRHIKITVQIFFQFFFKSNRGARFHTFIRRPVSISFNATFAKSIGPNKPKHPNLRLPLPGYAQSCYHEKIFLRAVAPVRGLYVALRRQLTQRRRPAPGQSI